MYCIEHLRGFLVVLLLLVGIFYDVNLYLEFLSSQYSKLQNTKMPNA